LSISYFTRHGQPSFLKEPDLITATTITTFWYDFTSWAYHIVVHTPSGPKTPVLWQRSYVGYFLMNKGFGSCGVKNARALPGDRITLFVDSQNNRGNKMVFCNKDEGNERHGTVIEALGINPKTLTINYLQSLEKEFGCVFEKGELLIWVETNAERAEQIFDSLRKRNCSF
jgi:hypothetical protein